MERDILRKLYYTMLRIRMVEEKIAELYPEQEMRCPVHLCIGQEAVPAGVSANLSDSDYMLSNHRSHGHYLAKGGDLRRMLAEIYGKSTGCSGGKGGSMHLVDLGVGILGTTPIVSGSLPVAVGVAFGSHLKGEEKVTVTYFGEGATEEGVFFESLNFAALKKVPILFVCENNLYSVYSPLSVRQSPERNNLSIAKALGIQGERGNGNDVKMVYELAGRAVSQIRRGAGPYYLEFDTYRWREHCGPNYDNDLGYRTELEYHGWQEKCPVGSYEKELIAEGIMTIPEVDDARERIAAEIADAVRFAKSSPLPSENEIFQNLYAGE